MRKPTKPSAGKSPAKKSPAKGGTTTESINSWGEIKVNGKLVPYSSKSGQRIRRQAHFDAKKEGAGTMFEKVNYAPARKMADIPTPAKATVKKSPPAIPMGKKTAKLAKKSAKKK